VLTPFVVVFISLVKTLKPFLPLIGFFNRTSPSTLVLENFFLSQKSFQTFKKSSSKKHGALPHTPLAF
jgi:hypothetical protein